MSPRLHRTGRSKTGGKTRGGGKRKAFDALAEAVEDGHLSLIEALRLAERGSSTLSYWHEEHSDRVRREPPRRPKRAPQAVPPQEAIARAVTAIRRRVGRRRGVMSVHWGARFSKGHVTGEAGVVVTVRAKRPRSALKQRNLLPRSVAIDHDGKHYIISVDVQSSGAPGVLHEGGQPVRPGDFATLTVSGGDVGTLSAILDGPNPVAVLSGHVGVKKGLSVTATTAAGESFSLGTITKVVETTLVDGAAAGPISSDAVSALAREPATVRPTDVSLVNEKVFLLLRGDFSPASSYVSDVHATADFWYGNQTNTLKDLIALSPQVTSGGDSGAPVIDFNSQLLGFVLGAKSGKTYLLPAERVLNAVI